MTRPLVSVVIATYNSSHLLSYALASLRHSDFSDWEAIVVGDHCTDDTEEVVESFGDDRIRFLNLEKNSGQQSTPNNIGIDLARGTYLCFLNQDDLFLPNHLSMNIEWMRDSKIDLICCPYAEILPGQIDRIEEKEVVARVQGFAPSGRFDPRRFQVASSWFMRREVAKNVGRWRLESETFVTPSQDWIFRAWRLGIHIHCPRDYSLIALYSGDRANSYRHRNCPEHDFIFREVVASSALRATLDKAIETSIHGKVDKGRSSLSPRKKSGLVRWKSKGIRKAQKLLMNIGIHPNAPLMLFRYGGRGGYIRWLKKRTG